MRLPTRLLPLAAFALLAPPALADEASDKQTASAVANLKKVGVAAPTVTETASLIVCGNLPDAKAKPFAAGLEKVHAKAREALKYEATDKPWPGKLTVYVLTERKLYSLFLLQVAAARTKAPYHLSLKGDEPYVVKGVDVGEKPTESELASDAGRLVAAALLARKGGATEFPDWVTMGFGRATVARADGPSSKRLTDLRAKAKASVLGVRGKADPAAVGDVWAAERRKDADVLETSLMDFLAYGPGAARFPSFVGGFLPAENQPTPSVEQVLEGMKWKPEELDKEWKKYVQTGK